MTRPGSRAHMKPDGGKKDVAITKCHDIGRPFENTNNNLNKQVKFNANFLPASCFLFLPDHGDFPLWGPTVWRGEMEEFQGIGLSHLPGHRRWFTADPDLKQKGKVPLTNSRPLLIHHPLWFTRQMSHNFTFEFTVATSCILTFISLSMSLLSYHLLSCKSAWIPLFLIKTCSFIVLLSSALYEGS